MEALFRLYEKVNRSINDDELIQLHCIGNSFTIRGYIQSTGLSSCGRLRPVHVLYFPPPGESSTIGVRRLHPGYPHVVSVLPKVTNEDI